VLLSAPPVSFRVASGNGKTQARTERRDVNPLERLLELQAHDTRIAQLEHRHAQLPERAELRELQSQSEELAERIEAARQQHAELERLQRRYDDDLTLVLAKRDRERNLLYSGEVTAIRQLQSLQEEVAALGLGLAANVPGRSPMLDGFGLIAFASLTPMICVLGYGMVA